jgi:hypothetical protein
VHELEGLHPLEGGAIRLKYRLDRRPGMPIESALTFYPRTAVEHVRKLAAYAKTIVQFRKIASEARNAPDRASYMDPAITPQVAEEFADLALYQATAGGDKALARKKRDEIIRKQKAVAASA